MFFFSLAVPINPMAVTALLTSLLHYCHQRILYQYRQFFTHSVCVLSTVAELQCMRQICYFFYMLCRRRLQADMDATWLGERIPEVTCPRTPLGDGAVPQIPCTFCSTGWFWVPMRIDAFRLCKKTTKWFDLAACPRKKDRTVKKSHEGVIFYLLSEKPPAEQICTEICTVG